MKSKRPTISPNFNFLGQLLEYEKELRKENILEPKFDGLSESSDCSQKRLCKRDMRKLSLSLDIDKKVNENAKAPLPRKEDHSPTSALAKLSFDAPNTEESEPPFSSMKGMRSKSCYGDWLRPHSDTSIEKKNDITTASKILSPVKEIKCDGLISEISSGYSDISTKFKETIRQKINHFSSLSTKSHEFQKHSENIPRNKKKSFETRRYKWQMEDKKGGGYDYFVKSNVKNTGYIPHVRSSENLYQAENALLKSGEYQEQYPYHNKNRPVHYSLSLNSDLHKLSDPSSSSVFIKRNLNHRTLNFNQISDVCLEEDIFNIKNLGSNPAISGKEYFTSNIFSDKNQSQSSNNLDYHLLGDDRESNAEVRNNNSGNV